MEDYGTGVMINFFIMIATLLTALFTGGLFYRSWGEKQPFIDALGEPRTEKEYKISLTMDNPTKKTQEIVQLRVLRPASSSLCRIYNSRGTDIPERHRYKTSMRNVLTIKPESTETINLFVDKGADPVAAILLSAHTTWPKFPFLSYCKHRIKVVC